MSEIPLPKGFRNEEMIKKMVEAAKAAPSRMLPFDTARSLGKGMGLGDGAAYQTISRCFDWFVLRLELDGVVLTEEVAGERLRAHSRGADPALGQARVLYQLRPGK